MAYSGHAILRRVRARRSLAGLFRHANGVKNTSPGQAKRRPGSTDGSEQAALKVAEAIAECEHSQSIPHTRNLAVSVLGEA